jgi:hypothetical protein
MAKAVITTTGKFSETVRVWTGSAQSSKSKMAREITDHVMGEALNFGVSNTMREMALMQKHIKKTVDAEVARLSRFINQFLMQQRGVERYKSVPTAGNYTAGRVGVTRISTAEMMSHADKMKAYKRSNTPTPGGELEWQNLSPSWLDQKRPQKNFYRGQTGALAAEFKGLDEWVKNDLGGVEVSLRRDLHLPHSKQGTKVDRKLRASSGTKFLLGNIDVRIFPRVGSSALPGLRTGRWSTAGKAERLPGLSSTTRAKLSGGYRAKGPTAGLYRPMLTPAAQFWAMYRLPMALAWAVRNPITRTRRETNAAGSAFGNQD